MKGFEYEDEVMLKIEPIVLQDESVLVVAVQERGFKATAGGGGCGIHLAKEPEEFVDTDKAIETSHCALFFTQSNAAQSLIEDYTACLELGSEEPQTIEDTKDDIGVLIIQLLLENINRPPPNITHSLLKFHVDVSVERTVLQPKFHYSCLKVILDILEYLSKP
ncbi:hypothetical protein C5167_017993 [Papaver somniferum]|uniref:Uncharacterized protein n=1 Tax=Papaver somniferum TaxID=3469 RepID=A0A4Y7IPY4_PAPSO|nr:hypothetical protein C5167_017993 [Papaver somniferum]